MSWSTSAKRVIPAGIVGVLLGVLLGGGVAGVFMQGKPLPPSTPPVLTSADSHSEVRTLFYSNIDLDPSSDCDVVFPVERTIEFVAAQDAHDAELRAAAVLAQLFAGPTPVEKRQGFSSFFSGETTELLRKVRIQEGDERTAYINLHDMRQTLAGANSSCGSLSFLAQLDHTLRATIAVSTIRYAFEGDPELFYNWMQIGCGATEKLCDPAPFQ